MFLGVKLNFSKNLKEMFIEEVKNERSFLMIEVSLGRRVWVIKSVGDVVRLAEVESRVVMNICVKLGDVGNLDILW